MAIDVVFETHCTTEDNERGYATGWLPGKLSPQGRREAQALGLRRREDGIAAVFASDLRRSGQLNGSPATDVHARRPEYLDRPHPDGESWRAAVGRVGRFIGDLPSRWDGKRVLVIGHVATRWGLDHYLSGTPLETLAEQDFAWQEGWEYRLD